VPSGGDHGCSMVQQAGYPTGLTSTGDEQLASTSPGKARLRRHAPCRWTTSAAVAVARGHRRQGSSGCSRHQVVTATTLDVHLCATEVQVSHERLQQVGHLDQATTVLSSAMPFAMASALL
jgi:hypothetical protein